MKLGRVHRHLNDVEAYLRQAGAECHVIVRKHFIVEWNKGHNGGSVHMRIQAKHPRREVDRAIKRIQRSLPAAAVLA